MSRRLPCSVHEDALAARTAVIEALQVVAPAPVFVDLVKNPQLSCRQFAFEKAAAISPNHPGPPFFLGLGLAQAGKLDEAGDVWRGLLARAPKDAPWKADLESRLAQIGQAPSAKAAPAPVK